MNAPMTPQSPVPPPAGTPATTMFTLEWTDLAWIAGIGVAVLVFAVALAVWRIFRDADDYDSTLWRSRS